MIEIVVDTLQLSFFVEVDSMVSKGLNTPKDDCKSERKESATKQN